MMNDQLNPPMGSGLPFDAAERRSIEAMRQREQIRASGAVTHVGPAERPLRAADLPLTQYQALQRILLETAGTELPTSVSEARDRIRRIAALVGRATRTEATEWQIVNGWIAELDPRFDEPMPLVRVDALPGFASWLDEIAPPAWQYTPEGHDDQYEYTTSADCDGSHVQRYRRTPARRDDAGDWEKVDEIPPVEQRTLRPLYDEAPRP